MTSAIIVGSGPNGLAAAITLARAGVDVTVLELAATVGGGMRSAELMRDGIVHDVCSAVHPMAVASPFFRSLDLAARGLEFAWPEVQVAHPLDDGTAGVLHRDVARTAAGLGRDAAMWRRTFAPLAGRFDDLADDALDAPLHVPRHPLLLGLFGAQAALPAAASWRRWRGPRARALFAGIAAHAFNRLDAPMSSAVGMLLTTVAHSHGWPVAVGGSSAIAAALAAELTALGGRLETGVRVRGLRDLRGADVVMLDVSPRAAVGILGDAQPRRRRRAYRRFRQGAAVVKLDLVIRGDVPWTNPDCARAGTVHLGGDAAEVARAERDCARGTMPARPFVLVGQQYLADPSRSRGGLNPLWAYAHVPRGHADARGAAAAIVDQIERFAPGFRDIIVDRRVLGTAEMEAYNPNYAGGDIIGGDSGAIQLIARPVAAPDPYATGVPGVYLCSASTPPGAGVHGMCGANAAARALAALADGRGR